MPSQALQGFHALARWAAQPVGDVFSLGRAVFEGSDDGNLLDHVPIVAGSATAVKRGALQRSVLPTQPGALRAVGLPDAAIRTLFPFPGGGLFGRDAYLPLWCLAKIMVQGPGDLEDHPSDPGAARIVDAVGRVQRGIHQTPGVCAV